MKTRTALSAALLASAGMATGALAEPPAIAAAGMSDLDIMAHFFMPLAPVEAMMLDSCSKVYRTRLETWPDEIALEQAIPGIHDAMVASLVAYCEKNLPAKLDEVHDKTRARISARFTPAELGRLADTYRGAVYSIVKIRVEVRDGDTAVGAAKRADLGAQFDSRAFEATQQALFRSPGGAALIERVAALQKETETHMQSDLGVIFPLLQQGLKVAQQAGNSYARSKGFKDVYSFD